MASIVLGIAALVAINSFNYNLVSDIDKQAATLLGADIVISENKPIPEELLTIADSLPGEKASQMQLFSMSYLPSVDETQFVNIRALEGGFPFYGILKTDPPEASDLFRNSKSVLVDDGMMIQYELGVGDSIKLGQATFEIAGRLQSAFGSSAIGGTFAPAVYMSKDHLTSTELVQPGSLVDYQYFYKTPDSFDADEWKSRKRKKFRDESVRIETIEDRKENLEEAFSNLNSFLNIVALVSLLLGCIGVASSVLIYIKTKIPSIAVFRCLGMKANQSFAIYFFQIFILGAIGVLVGAGLGALIQVYLPILFKDFLPYEVHMAFSGKAFAEGIAVGLIITTLFALGPLLGVRDVSPLQTLRVSSEGNIRKWSPWKILVYAAIVISIFFFLMRLTGSWRDGAVMTGGLFIAFLVLVAVAKLITWSIRKFFPTGWSYVFRQGLSNLYRPNNQTQTLLLSIGLGTSVLTMLFIIQGLLLKNVASMEAGNQPNTILYGIERDQKDALADLTRKFDLPIIQQVPIVTMALAGWQGKSKKEWMADTSRTASRWAINREARVSFRDTLSPDETLLEGTFTGHVKPGDSVFISLADNWARAMDVGIGDELVWNVQGAMLTTYVGSIREISFNSMNTRFFVLFPNGVLENAPQFQVLVTKSPNIETTARYRRDVVKAFPNVSVIDLGSILSALNDILTKVSYVIKFMAGFSILTGLIVLIASLLLSKFQRVKESVLLRTIGANRRQIFMINATEYMILGALSAATGIVLSLVGSYFMATQQLELDFKIQWLPIVGVFLFVVGMTVIIGLLNSREVLNKSPLEVLRKEVG